jgi:hypothetical protein
MRQPLWLASSTIVAAALFCCATYAGTYQTIMIDGSFADWNGVPVLFSDGGDSATVDIGDVQIANDDEHLYIRATYPNNLAQSTYIALDIDSNPATGYDIFGLGMIGSEAGWQNDFAFRQSTGVFNSGGLSGQYFSGGHALLSPHGDSASREWAISLDAMFAADNSPVFPDGIFSLMLYSDSGSGDVTSVIQYTLATAIPECSTLALAALASVAFAARRHRGRNIV